MHAALVSTMVESERQYAYMNNSSSPIGIPEYISGYRLLTGPRDGRAATYHIEIVAQSMYAGTDCGVFILRNTGERFTWAGNTRQPASPACWS